jgi:F-type H+-transporting ATPase subunit delta
MSTGTAQAYATAVHAIAVAEGALEIVESELASIAEVIATDPSVIQRLSDRQLPVEQRMRMLDSGVLATAHPATRAALGMLIGAERIGHLRDVATALSERSASDVGRTYAEVQVAQPLSAAQTKALQKALEKATGSELTMRIVIDPSVIGGVRARIGDTVIDGSVARRLSQLRTRING